MFQDWYEFKSRMAKLQGQLKAQDEQRRYERRWRAVARLGGGLVAMTLVGLLFLPPPRCANAIMVQVDSHKIGWEDTSGGMRFCWWSGCWEWVPAPSVPRPYVPPYGHDQS